MNNELNYETEVGAVFKKRLAISPGSIFWDNRSWPTDSITKIKYGALTNVTNGAYLTSYHIAFGTDEREAKIKTISESKYQEFTYRLWKIVGVRLLFDSLNKFMNGARIKFDSRFQSSEDGCHSCYDGIIVDDCGIEMIKKEGLFSNRKISYHKWESIHFKNFHGLLWIWPNENDEFIIDDEFITFSYMRTYNICILGTILEQYSKIGGGRLSNILDYN